MRVLLLSLLVGCAVPKRPAPSAHPASADAPAGRLAGPPPALRPGVVDYKNVPPLREGPPADGGHHHHGH